MHSFDRKDIFKKSGIYCIKNIINNRVYIGSSCNLYKRFNAHYNELNKNIHVNKALNNFCIKYGIDKLFIDIIEFCEKDKLIERENFYIKEYKAYGHGFNCCPIAGSVSNLEVSKSTRNKLSIARKKYIYNNLDKNNFILDKGRKIVNEMYKSGELIIHTKGKTASDYTKNLQSLAKKGKKSNLSENTWLKIREKALVSNSGENSHFCKLTLDKVHEIKKEIANKENKNTIAKKYNISVSTVYDITNKRSWKHVNPSSHV